MERKALELYQDRVEEARLDRVEEARLDCLAMEIVKRKKKAVARRAQSELNLQKENEVVETLATMIKET